MLASGLLHSRLQCQFASQRQDVKHCGPRPWRTMLCALNMMLLSCFIVGAEVEAVADRSTGVVLCCNLGGSLEAPSPTTPGIQSRSLMAAYELVKHGYAKVRILKGGVNNWRDIGKDLWQYEDDTPAAGDDKRQ
jgi:hypothetical protein